MKKEEEEERRTIRNSLLELYRDHQIKNPAQMLSLLTP